MLTFYRRFQVGYIHRSQLRDVLLGELGNFTPKYMINLFFDLSGIGMVFFVHNVEFLLYRSDADFEKTSLAVYAHDC